MGCDHTYVLAYSQGHIKLHSLDYTVVFTNCNVCMYKFSQKESSSYYFYLLPIPIWVLLEPSLLLCNFKDLSSS